MGWEGGAATDVNFFRKDLVLQLMGGKLIDMQAAMGGG